MEEATAADDIVIINHGEIVAHGTPEQLKDEHCHDIFSFVPTDASAAESVLRERGIQFTEDKGVYTVTLRRTADSVPIIAALGDLIDSMQVRSGTLDEAFIDITEADE